ncbi:endonuclease/exonuclease/phosphatase family protein [Agromyces aerolatus]|uniref:endonuclease/exonuclease/phosphatase family protein n=1 Tax=Agromyces sp. LY-1074 TaxID=3074080 RepID=UPI002858AE34|nr:MULTISPECIES: endonuclease/exonuclease/phosphatase family protein [unclassified Agromyces]MDR5700205.1 endonuclease/exonuclease/phosphatase family protein [Agromyces sp. LY-1074]MDR5706427.1 endonuclease/exonuclease/phosphatase family protein [Agromyces sp. LY-1358]
MTFNIRRPLGRLAWRRADRWSHRRALVRALLAAERPTLLCLQEAVPRQLREVLAALGPGHRPVGYGRGRRRTGEGCPVVYDVRRLELLEWSQHALSEHLHRDGSRSWGNLMPRIAVVARFRDRSTGRELRVVNTHLDPFSSRSRLRSVAVLRSMVGDAPTIVTGDLNAGDRSRTVRALLAGGLLVDAWTAGERRLTAEVGTYGGYRMPRPSGPRLDRILVSQGVTVDRVAINARRIDGAWPSDHLPVQAVLHIEGSAA